MASRRTAPATATLSPLAITRYCCSTAAPADRIGRQGGKQTGRRKEGDGEVFEKSLGMRHFRVFRSREEAELAPFLDGRSRWG